MIQIQNDGLESTPQVQTLLPTHVPEPTLVPPERFLSGSQHTGSPSSLLQAFKIKVQQSHSSEESSVNINSGYNNSKCERGGKR